MYHGLPCTQHRRNTHTHTHTHTHTDRQHKNRVTDAETQCGANFVTDDFHIGGRWKTWRQVAEENTTKMLQYLTLDRLLEMLEQLDSHAGLHAAE